MPIEVIMKCWGKSEHGIWNAQAARVRRYESWESSSRVSIMNNDDEWSSLLQDHPIFSLPKKLGSSLLKREDSLELSTSTLPKFTNQDPTDDGPTPSGRRQTMVLKDSELILAAGRELRIASLSESRLNKSLRKSYKASLPLIFVDSLLNIEVVYRIHRHLAHQVSNLKYTNLL